MGLISQGSAPSWKSELPPIPKWKLDKTEAKAKLIYRESTRFFKNTTLDDRNRQNLLEVLTEWAGIAGTTRAALAALESLLPFNNQVLTNELARTLAYQLAANANLIKVGIPVKKFTGVSEAQWVPMEILGFTRVDRGTKILAGMRLLVLDGTFAGFEAFRIMPLGFLFVFANDLGFCRRRPYEEPVDLIGFRFVAWVEPCASDDLKFDKYWLTSSMAKYDTALVKKLKPTDKELEGDDE